MPGASQLFYEENGRVAAIFWEWRHKVILLCVSALGGVVAIAAWIYERQLAWALPAPLLFGAITFFVCWRLDSRIATVLEQCYERGYALESLASSEQSGLRDVNGVYGSFHTRPAGVFRAKDRPPGSFTRLLFWMYVSLMVLMLALAVLAAGMAWRDTDWLKRHSSVVRPSLVHRHSDSRAAPVTVVWPQSESETGAS